MHSNSKLNAINHFRDYSTRLQENLKNNDWSNIANLAFAMRECWIQGHRVFLCGNGGSAGNAIHLANDFLYGIAKKTGGGLKVNALSENSSVITCLANDVGYEHIYSEQLAVQASRNDILIVLSGSGNSPNIIKVLEKAKEIGVKSFAILGFSGGKSKEIADVAIHFQVNDMQLAEDMQLIIGHMIMQWFFSVGKESI